QIQTVRPTIRRLLARCNVQYGAVPFDHTFYQECFDAAVQRGYPVSSSDPFSVLSYLRQGTIYGATAGAHLSGTHRAFQIWIALFTAYAICVDDMSSRFPEEMANIRAFNDRFVRGEEQGNQVLDALAGTLRETPMVFGGPVPANLVTTSALNFVTANVIEWETRGMQILATANQYPTYQRVLSGVGEAYAIMVFPSDIPFGEYIQAIPEMSVFINNVNDILSYYKEELDGETANQISMMAARKGISKVEAFEELADTSGELYGRIVSILEDGNDGTPGFSRACEAFKQFVVGYVGFHASLERYRLREVTL
ncbi:terpenoid synthase, partial [Gyrodon lividus]